MINDLIRSIALERSETTEEELMVNSATNDDIRDTFLDGDIDEGSDISEAEINSLISKIPESSTDLSTDEISALAENFMELVTPEDIVFESSGKTVEDSIEDVEKTISSLESKEKRSEADDKELKKAQGKLKFLKMVKSKKKDDDSDGEKAEEGATMHFFSGSDDGETIFDPATESLEDIEEACAKEGDGDDSALDLDDLGDVEEASADEKLDTDDKELTEAVELDDDLDIDFDEDLGDIVDPDLELEDEDIEDEDQENEEGPIDLDDIE